MSDRPKTSRHSRQAKQPKNAKQNEKAQATPSKPSETPKLAKKSEHVGKAQQSTEGEQQQPQMPNVEDVWTEAQKIRKLLSSQVAKLRREEDVSNIPRYEKLAEILAHLRLLCVQTLFMDYIYAAKENVEETLWQAHVLVNSEYRNSLNRVRTAQLAVLKSKLETPYVRFLKLSQRFYEEYIRRLANRYGIPELQVAARRISSEQKDAEDSNSGNGGKDCTNDVPSSIRLMALHSCYMTLIRLGDLVRYRLQVRHNKKPSNHLALTYYELAHDLKPTVGHAHHQMAIIYLDEKRDFDIVYHFFRSLAIEEPHPRATNNLELQFKATLSSVKSGMPKQSGPYDPLMMWFLRLHAYCYRGEPFPQQRELEAEVIHRLDAAIRDPDASAMLLKMVLINMAAYYVATQSVKENEASLYPKTILRLNFLFFGTILNIFKTELETLKVERIDWEDTHAGKDSSDNNSARPQSTPTELVILPLVRLYTSWLVACRAEVGIASPNVPVEQVGKLLAECLSLIAELHGGDGLSLAPHMLPEDHMAIGLLPLNDPTLEPRCRLSFNQELNVVKPLCDYYDGKLLEGWEAGLARMLDILLCGYALTEDPALPFAFHEDRLVFTYGEDVPTTQQPQASPQQYGVQEPSQSFEYVKNPESVRRPAAGDTQPSLEVAPNDASSNSVKGSNTAYERGRNGHVSANRYGPNTMHIQPKNATMNTTEYDFSENSEVMNMVNDFMQPPDAHSAMDNFTASAQQEYDDSSYGMHSATANEVFGGVRPRDPSAFGAASASAFPALPWSMVYQPTPNTRSAELARPDVFSTPALANHGQDFGGAFNDMNLQGHQAGSGRVHSLADQYPQYGPLSPDVGLAAHRARLLQAFDVPKATSRSASQDYTVAGADAWPRALPPTNGHGSQGGRSMSHSHGYGGSRSTLANDDNHNKQEQQFFSHEGHFPGSSMAFSQASSLFQSTPYNWDPKFGPLTAFGRGSLQGTDDPTHYKNLIRSSANETDAYAGTYDQMVLQAARKGGDDEEGQRRAR
ncbi:hypothetical protein D7B24_000818 [Verticillium nonalfalfae]|uniref:Nonsense-mediated mRNA decay factor n=1 Tax=Verticillium nonalfalfae TaxID=1051616 RepID=A0A3M9Y1U2_9PEZI|nr:uncharacterized protein D7B24_000818 [Verticillium nonalfalfae]RNJ54221.1 hypothetical protein D7B24_000818 [Verticillium nonalfalfae]